MSTPETPEALSEIIYQDAEVDRKLAQEIKEGLSSQRSTFVENFFTLLLPLAAFSVLLNYHKLSTLEAAAVGAGIAAPLVYLAARNRRTEARLEALVKLLEKHHVIKP